tara:strand:+ start:5670 stop:6152 length:483 start_codon:yes stop_codon:yes gene_type:complete
MALLFPPANEQTAQHANIMKVIPAHALTEDYGEDITGITYRMDRRNMFHFVADNDGTESVDGMLFSSKAKWPNQNTAPDNNSDVIFHANSKGDWWQKEHLSPLTATPNHRQLNYIVVVWDEDALHVVEQKLRFKVRKVGMTNPIGGGRSQYVLLPRVDWE